MNANDIQYIFYTCLLYICIKVYKLNKIVLWYCNIIYTVKYYIKINKKEGMSADRQTQNPSVSKVMTKSGSGFRKMSQKRGDKKNL